MEEHDITVLRLGHRPGRDRRMTTHIALVARALGARSVVISEKDPRLEEAVEDVARKFGGDFSVRTETKWKSFVKKWNGTVVHLTMYGEPLEKVIDNIPKEDVLVIVGAEKVPPEAYQLSDFNVSVTNQPHSEVAALAIFIDRLTDSAWTGQDFKGRMRVIPTGTSKIVIDSEGGYLSDEECRRLLVEVGCGEDVISHVRAVTKVAVEIAESSEADVDLVRTAAMLHDIGRTKTHGPGHGFEGAEILRSYGFPENIVLIVERHVGGGFPAKEAVELGLQEKDMIPSTLEEKIVCIADKLVEDDKKVPIDREIKKLKDKGLDKAAKRLQALYQEMKDVIPGGIDKIDA
jgi:tRNA (cytidine56-2'-O)-methyltransferase